MGNRLCGSRNAINGVRISPGLLCLAPLGVGILGSLSILTANANLPRSFACRLAASRVILRNSVTWPLHQVRDEFLYAVCRSMLPVVFAAASATLFGSDTESRTSWRA